MNSNGVIKARARWLLFFDASWTSTAVARKIAGKSDATQRCGFIFAVFPDKHVCAVCFPSMFLDISRPRNFKVGLSVPEVTLWSFVNWPFPWRRPPAARLLTRKWSLQGGWGVQIEEEACMMSFCPEAGNSHERLNQILQLPQKSNFGSNQEGLKWGWTCSGSSVWLLVKCHIMRRGAGATQPPRVIRLKWWIVQTSSDIFFNVSDSSGANDILTLNWTGCFLRAHLLKKQNKQKTSFLLRESTRLRAIRTKKNKKSLTSSRSSFRDQMSQQAAQPPVSVPVLAAPPPPMTHLQSGFQELLKTKLACWKD